MKNAEFDFVGGKSSYILNARNVIDTDICSGLIDECLKYYDKLFFPGPTLGGVNAFIKNSMDYNFSKYSAATANVPAEVFGQYEDAITEALFGVVSYYINEYRELWTWPGIRDTGFRLQRYIKNYGYYRQHVDGNPWGPVQSESRVLAAVVYLNTVTKGGETFFPEHDIKVPAVAGSVALFPSAWTHPHQGNTPIGSDKWMISTFYLCDKQVDDSVVQDEAVLEPAEEKLEESSVK